MTVIEARGLRKAFGSTIALDGVDLHVEEGRILGIIGPTAPAKAPPSTPFSVSSRIRGNFESWPQPLDRARATPSRCLFHFRRRHPPALAARFASD